MILHWNLWDLQLNKLKNSTTWTFTVSIIIKINTLDFAFSLGSKSFVSYYSPGFHISSQITFDCRICLLGSNELVFKLGSSLQHIWASSWMR